MRRKQTDAEKKLWFYLRNRTFENYKFRRQYVIEHFIVDLCCLEKMLIIELDGGQHNQQKAKDRRRTDYLAQKGYRIIRFWDHEVLGDIYTVLTKIHNECNPAVPPHLGPLPQGGEENSLFT